VWSFDLVSTWLRRSPAFETESVETSARTVPGGSITVPHGLVFLGAQVSGGWVFGDRLVMPTLGAGLSAAVGSHRPVRASLDGSIAELRPWSALRAVLLLPGLGVRGKERRLQWQVVVRPSYALVTTNGSVAAGPEAVPIHGRASSLNVSAEGELCRRLDPTSRVCLFVGLTLYEHHAWNGGQLGLRWEAGP
jgi:hypothetical protein